MPTLKELEDLLEKKKTREFYKLSASLDCRMNEKCEQRVKEGKRRYTREDVAAKLWSSYYMVLAPFIDDGNRLYLQEDINVKRAFRRINNENKEWAEILSMESQKLKDLRSIYSAAMLKSLRDFRAFAEKNKEKAEEINWKRRHCKNIGIKYYELRENEFKTHYDYGQILTYTDGLDHDGRALAEELIQAFPKDGASVQKYLKQAGYCTNIECAKILQKAVGRTKENKYLYAGLPDEKEVKKEIEREKQWNQGAYERDRKKHEAHHSIQLKELEGRIGHAYRAFDIAAHRIMDEKDDELRKKIVIEANKRLNATIPQIMAKDIYQMTDEDEKIVLFTYSRIFSDVTEQFIKEENAKLDETALSAKEKDRNRIRAYSVTPADYLNRR